MLRAATATTTTHSLLESKGNDDPDDTDRDDVPTTNLEMADVLCLLFSWLKEDPSETTH